jgi:hypothetical protein
MAMAVVDVLEVIQIEHQQRRRDFREAADACRFLRQRGQEVAPVGQAGERIGAGQVVKLGLHVLACGDVLLNADVMADDAAIVEYRGDGQLLVVKAAVALLVDDFARARCGRPE